MKQYNESMEMYLETIYTLQNSGKTVHAIDIANELNYSKPSVSRAMKLLVSNNYITINQQQDILLTEEGYNLAKSVYEKHTILTNFFMSVGADKALAEENACRIEHVITDELFLIIKNKMN